MLLTACCVGSISFFVMGFVMSKAFGRWHFYLWLPIVMSIVGFTVTLVVVFAPAFLLSLLVYTSNINSYSNSSALANTSTFSNSTGSNEVEVQLRVVIALGLVQVWFSALTVHVPVRKVSMYIVIDVTCCGV